MSEYRPYQHHPAAKIEERFDLYRRVGFGMIRTGIGWRDLEPVEGKWRIPPWREDYLRRVIAGRFRMKLGVRTLGAPPAWFLEAHPEARIRNARGDYSTNDLSLWYPGLHALLAGRADEAFGLVARRGLFAATDFIFVDLGPASEPIYPAAWTMRQKHFHGPWWYDENAQADFIHAMRHKHPSLDAANRLWGTHFAAWARVRLPRPGEHPGDLWRDALLWYRDCKRRFIRWQVANYHRALNKHIPSGSRPRPIIMVPGSHITSQQWEQAVRTGRPDGGLVVMCDSEFLLQLAQQTDSWLQDTGVENTPESRYLRHYLDTHRLKVPIWGENAGLARIARNPSHLIDVVLADGFYGLDFVNSSYLFAADGVTPNQTYRALGAACERFRRSLG